MKKMILTLPALMCLVLGPALAPTAVHARATLDEAEAATLQFMREEEKLARDVYRTLYAAWGKPIFANISESEQVHTDKVASLIEKYRVHDPVEDDTTGVFVNDELRELYHDLVERGEVSLVDALMAGAFIEEADMHDLHEAIEETDNPDIDKVYENLLRGSRNHLRAFVGAIESLGVVYEAQLLAPEEVDAIVDSDIERG